MFFVFRNNNWNCLQFNTLSMFQSNWSKFHCISFQYFSHGRWSGLFLFFRKQLKWSTIQYTSFTTTLGFIGLFGQYIAVPILSGWLRLHDSTISLIDAVTRYVYQYLCLFTIFGFVYKTREQRFTRYIYTYSNVSSGVEF